MKLLQILGLGAALALQLTSAHYLSDEQIMEDFTPYDSDKDNHISTNEMDVATRQQLKQFEDPYVSAEEMTKFVTDIVDSLMQNDVDQDGKLSFQEFADMMRKEHQDAGDRERKFNEEMAEEATLKDYIIGEDKDIEVVSDQAEEAQTVQEVKGAEL